MMAAVFLKAPRAGEVKTRLAESLGPEGACAAYRLLVDHTLRQLPEHWKVEILFAPANAKAEMRDWLGAVYSYYPQCEGDLGDRQAAAVARLIRHDSVILVGGDCPYLDVEVLSEVESQLVDHEAVLVPACDGGYVALALKRYDEGLFDDISWSTDRVAEQLELNAHRVGLDLVKLKPLEDVDTLAEWERAKSAMSNE